MPEDHLRLKGVEAIIAKWIREQEAQVLPPPEPAVGEQPEAFSEGRRSAITVSYQYASGGRELAKMLADTLQFELFENDDIELICRAPKMFSRLRNLLSPETREIVLNDWRTMLSGSTGSPSQFVRRLCKAVLAAHEYGGVVIAIRGANLILGPDRGFHIRVVCPKAQRLNRIMTDEKVSAFQAQEILRAKDQEQRDFARGNFGADIDDAANYDLVVNSDLLKPVELVDFVVGAFESKMSAVHKRGDARSIRRIVLRHAGELPEDDMLSSDQQTARPRVLESSYRKLKSSHPRLDQITTRPLQAEFESETKPDIAELRRQIATVRREFHELAVALVGDATFEAVEAPQFIQIRVYLSETNERAAHNVLYQLRRVADEVGIDIVEEYDLELGSIFARFIGKFRDTCNKPEVAERLRKVERAAEQCTLQKSQAANDLNLANSVSGLINALKDIPTATIQLGSLLLVKTTSAEEGSKIVARNLTQNEMIHLEQDPSYIKSPSRLLKELRDFGLRTAAHEPAILRKESPVFPSPDPGDLLP